jgi:hypothetical protein
VRHAALQYDTRLHFLQAVASPAAPDLAPQRMQTPLHPMKPKR